MKFNCQYGRRKLSSLNLQFAVLLQTITTYYTTLFLAMFGGLITTYSETLNRFMEKFSAKYLKLK